MPAEVFGSLPAAPAVDATKACFIVRNANGRPSAMPSWRMNPLALGAKLLAQDEARRIATHIATPIARAGRSAADFKRTARDDRQSMVKALPIEPEAADL